MNVVRDKPEAKWLPSRHRFALARMIGYVMLVTARPSAPALDHLVLAIDRDQSAVENFAASAWYLASTICFVAAALPVPLAAALTIAVPVTLVGIQMVQFAVGLLSKSRAAVSVAFFLLGLMPALYFAARPGWVRFIADFFIAVVSLNAVAAIVMWLLRDRVREVEQRCAA